MKRHGYEGKVYRPPSEADAYIFQATIRHVRGKRFRVRPLEDRLGGVAQARARARFGPAVSKVFVVNGEPSRCRFPIDCRALAEAPTREGSK